LITHFIGRALVGLSSEQQSLEADFRSDVEVLSNQAESIAQDHGETYFRQSLLSKLKSICRNAYAILHVKLGLTAFNGLYQQISYVFPYIVAAPLYFAKQTTLGQLMDIAFSFTQIQLSLSWFSDSYSELANYGANVKRIVEFENAMSDEGLVTTERSIVVQEEPESTTLSVQNLNLARPSSTNHIISELNLTFRPGENTLIKGRSGMGKSTLFKAIAGAWRYGDGEISVPGSASMVFLPQRPVLHDNTLKAVLAYPQPVSTYTDEEYEAALRAVGGTDECVAALDTHASWSKRLSPGEQQRISIARAVLQRPDWLFLDEATSAMDEETERDMYSLVREQLTDTTFISIAHRSTVEEHHTRVVPLSAGEPVDTAEPHNTHAFFARRVPIAAARVPVAAANDEGALIESVENSFS
jgi:putative ATP-binding cassette transporter